MTPEGPPRETPADGGTRLSSHAFVADVVGEGGTARAVLDVHHYSIVSRTGDSRGAASLTQDRSGTVVFTSAIRSGDGSVLVEASIAGRQTVRGSLAVAGSGQWEMESSRQLSVGTVQTEAIGDLDPQGRVQLVRTRLDNDGAVAWKAVAEVCHPSSADAVTRPSRLTEGIVTFADGRTGRFKTVSFDDGRHTQSEWTDDDSHSSWSQQITDDGGSMTIVTHTEDADGSETTTRRWGGSESGGSAWSTTGRSVDSHGNPTWSTELGSEEHGSWGWNKSWDSSTTDASGQCTENQGVDVADASTGARSITVNTARSDGSGGTVETLTWNSSTGEGTKHTTEYDGKGHLIPGSDKTEQGTFSKDGKTFAPGQPGGGTRTPAPHGGGEGDGKDGAATSDDGGDLSGDTGGHPGLGWDGGIDALTRSGRGHPGRSGGSDGDADNPESPSIGGLLGEAFRAVAGDDESPGNEMGHGQDTGRPTPHIVVTGVGAVPLDAEWGDWADPAAHAMLARTLVGEFMRRRQGELPSVGRVLFGIASMSSAAI